jgi:phosphatidylglycerol:prolipoprotein diacylglycerol transferase
MNPITFPGLGITLQLDRVAFTIGSKPVYWYGIIIGIGFLLGAWYGSHIARRYGITEDNVTDMLIFALPLSIIGARIYYVVFYQELYRTADGSFDWSEAVAIWDGGLAIYGGIIAAVLTVTVFCLVKKLSIGALLDIGGFGLLIGQAIGRWGNFFNQEAYGAETTLPWRMGLVVNGQQIYVHPTFLYECLWNVAGFFLLRYIAKRWRKYDGQMFTLYVAWYGLGRFWIESLRSDSLYFFGLTFFGVPIRTSQMLAALSFLVAVALLIWNLKCKKHTPEELFVNRVVLPEKKIRKKKKAQTEASAEAEAEAPQDPSVPIEEREVSEETPSQEPSSTDENAKHDSED